MPKHPGLQVTLFAYNDQAEKLICHICGRMVKAVVPATTITYLVHAPNDICVTDNQPLRYLSRRVKNG